MKARLLHTLFILNLLIFAEFVLSDAPSKDIRALKEQSMMSVLYQQTAAEHLAGNIQTFKAAKLALNEALKDPTWTALPGQKNFNNKKTAIIVDVDETVLDNTAYEARMIIDGTKYPEGWIGWAKEAVATAVPGAKDFLSYAHSKGITIFYITNRVAELKEATQKNLTKLGIPWDESKETILMRGEKNWGSDKGPRRRLVGDQYRVLLIVGDNLGDFVDAKDNNLSFLDRKEIVTKYSQYWGTKWFLFQNITYGDWEGSLYNFDYSLSPNETHQARLNALQPSR